MQRYSETGINIGNKKIAGLELYQVVVMIEVQKKMFTNKLLNELYLT